MITSKRFRSSSNKVHCVFSLAGPFVRTAILTLLFLQLTTGIGQAAQRTCTRHPTSAVFWCDAALARGDTVTITWNPGTATGNVTDVTGNVAEVTITAVNGAPLRVGQKILIAPSDNICSSCRSSGTTAAIQSLPAIREVQILESVTGISAGAGTTLGVNFNRETVTFESPPGMIVIAFDAARVDGLVPVRLLDLAALSMPDFELAGAQFTGFGMEILSQNLLLDPREELNNLSGSVEFLHHFKANGIDFTLYNNAGVIGTFDMATGQMPELIAVADFSVFPKLSNPDRFKIELFADLKRFGGLKAFGLALTSGMNGFPPGLYVTSGPLANHQSDRLLHVAAKDEISVVKDGFNSNESLVFAQGAYGNGMLITEPRERRIQRLLADGAISTFATIGTEPFGPAVLEYGPDNALFVTDFSGGQILRVAPDGTSTTLAAVPLPPATQVALAGAKALTRDVSGRFGGGFLTGIFTANPVPTGHGALFHVSVDGATLTKLAGGLDGLEFVTPGSGPFGSDLFLATIGSDTTPGGVFTMAPTGTLTPFLQGIDAVSVAFDPQRVLGGGMFVADAGETPGEAGRIWRVTAVPPSGDFNSDGLVDLVLQRADGFVAFWLMDGTAVAAGVSPYQLPATWRISGAADFNNDVHTDIVLQNQDGTIAFWLMDGITIQEGIAPYQLPQGWRISATGDFNRDGSSDIVLQHADGTVAFWLMNGTTITQGLAPYSIPPEWQIAGSGRFNGDTQTDLVLQHQDGTVAFWLMQGTTVVQGVAPYQLPPGWHIVATGDFNSDGRTDIVLQHADNSVAFWLMKDLAIVEGFVPFQIQESGWLIVGPQ